MSSLGGRKMEEDLLGLSVFEMEPGQGCRSLVPLWP
jgi:hypothetical protein